MWDIFLLIVGAFLGVIATKIDDYLKRRNVIRRNLTSLREIPDYNPLADEILLIRQWNSRDRLNEQKAEIIYDETRTYDMIAPKITCPFISAPEEWEKMYADELKKEAKRSGAVSYVTYFSPDNKDTVNGDRLVLKVSTCDYLAHDVNSKYLSKYPEDWKKIKQTIIGGNYSEYFDNAMPGNVFVNFIVINGQTNHVLAIKRSSNELNGRNIWGLSGFETMNNIANVAHGSEEKSLHGIVYRGLWEELAVEREEVTQIAISCLSLVRHLGIMVTALVRVDLKGKSDNLKPGESPLSEGEFIQRIMHQSESGFEHSSIKWLPIDLKEMKNYIENKAGFYKDVIQTYDGNEAEWIRYAKLQMYQIWYNHTCIGITL
jgi:hypothetical protein